MIKNLFNISDLTRKDIESIILNKSSLNLKGKNIGLIFEKYSTRTRMSFHVGINHLEGNSIDIRFNELNISRDETFEDTFKTLNLYLDGLIYRTDNHNKLINASKYFHKPIINALSDRSHPCQILSDLYTLFEVFNTFDIHVLWIGDMNNVCFSLVEAVNLIKELSLTICTPTSISLEKKWSFNSNISIINDINDIDLSSINCVMTDVFISMNDKDGEEKVRLLKPYSVTSKLMENISETGVFMHCLPAKVGLEVSNEVFKSPQSIVWRQAYNRMVAQKKLLHFINWD